MSYELSVGAGLFLENAKNNKIPEEMIEQFCTSLLKAADTAMIAMKTLKK